MSAIFSFIGANLDKFSLLYQFAETGSVVLHNSSGERFDEGKKARDHFHVTSLCLATVGFLTLFEGKLSLLSRSLRIIPGRLTFIFPVLTVVACGVPLFLVAAAVCELSARILSPNRDLKHLLPSDVKPSDKPQIEVKLDQPTRVRGQHLVVAARLVMNLALAYFSANPYLFLATAGLELLSMGITTRWKWVAYTQTVIVPVKPQPKASHPEERVGKVAVTQLWRIFPPQSRGEPKNEQSVVTELHSKLPRLTTPPVNLQIAWDHKKEVFKQISGITLNSGSLASPIYAETEVSIVSDTGTTRYSIPVTFADEAGMRKLIAAPIAAEVTSHQAQKAAGEVDKQTAAQEVVSEVSLP